MPTRTRRALHAAVLAVGVAAIGTSTAEAVVPAPIELPDVATPEAPNELGAEAPMRLCELTEGSGVPCPAGVVNLSSPNPTGFEVMGAPMRVAEPLREPGKVLNGPNLQRTVINAHQEVRALEDYRKVRPTLAGDLDDPEQAGELLDFVAGPRHPGSGFSGADTGVDLTAAHGMRGGLLPDPPRAAATVVENATGVNSDQVIEPIRQTVGAFDAARGQLDQSMSESMTGGTARSNPVPGFGLPGEALLGGAGVGQVISALDKVTGVTNGNSGGLPIAGLDEQTRPGGQSTPRSRPAPGELSPEAGPETPIAPDSLTLLPTKAGPLADAGLPSGLDLGPRPGLNGELVQKLTSGGTTPRSDKPTLATGVLPPLRTDLVPTSGIAPGLIPGHGQANTAAPKPSAGTQRPTGTPLSHTFGPGNNIGPLSTVGLVADSLRPGPTGRGVPPVVPAALPATDLNGALPIDIARVVPGGGLPTDAVTSAARNIQPPVHVDRWVPDDQHVPVVSALGELVRGGQLALDATTYALQQASDQGSVGLSELQDGAQP